MRPNDVVVPTHAHAVRLAHTRARLTKRRQTVHRVGHGWIVKDFQPSPDIGALMRSVFGFFATARAAQQSDFTLQA